MRLLHTSDWHLGRSLHRTDLRTAQEAFVDALVGTVRDERVDAVLVAGDVYDRAIPPVEAVSLFDEALLRLRDAGARVVVTSGNHDSARRLGFAGSLVAHAGVHLRTRVDRLAVPVLLDDRHGPVVVYGIPYLEPEAVADALPPADVAEAGEASHAAGHAAGHAACCDGERAPRGHAGVMRRATAAVRADASRRGVGRTVVMAHAWVAGGAGSDSERDITVGGLGHVPGALFEGFGYVALGHLHGPQTLTPHLRYSGSPLPYSFSEAAHVKGSWLVEFDGRGLAHVERVPAPVHRRLAAVCDTLDALLTASRYEEHRDAFLAVTLTDTARPEAAMDRLRQRFPHVLTVAWEPARRLDAATSYGSRMRGKTDLGIATTFVEHVRRTPATPAERRLISTALQATRPETAIAAEGLTPLGGMPRLARTEEARPEGVAV